MAAPTATGLPTVAATAGPWLSVARIVWRPARVASKSWPSSKPVDPFPMLRRSVHTSTKPIMPLPSTAPLLGLAGHRAVTAVNLSTRISSMLVPQSRLGMPVARAIFESWSTRSVSTSTSADTSSRSPAGSPAVPSQHQRRAFSTNGISNNVLASREIAANRNPQSASTQNAFYQLLLKANRPDIVIERYESGQFAANAAATEAYNRALQMLQGSTPHMPAPVQAASHNVAAQQAGSNISVGNSTPDSGQHSSYTYSQGKGMSDSVKVVTYESTWSQVARWIKWIAAFIAVCYFVSGLMGLLTEYLTGGQRQRPDIKTGGSNVKAVRAQNQTVRFTDVHGCDEAKEELQEIVEFLRDPARFSTLGGRLPKGVLLVGPPGTGKTLLARAVAGEAGVPFFYMSASEFDEVFVGVGARRVRDLFSAAKSKSPAIIFIDELDAIGSKRSARDLAYNKQTLNQLLTELDGFDQTTNVIIIGATNFPQLLDKALTRPGRFDRHVVVSLPDVRGRIAILKHHSSKVKMDKDVNLDSIAGVTSGLSGAELANIVNQAAVRASKLKADSVNMAHFEWAKDKVIMGAERRSMVISDKEKLMTAYHEAGHALVQLHYEATSTKTKLYKVTILPRGGTLGHTAMLPEMDSYSSTANDMEASIAISLGGKAAEELAYGDRHTTTGVSGDLDHATSRAFNMVTRFGMSKTVGPVDFAQRYEYLSSETRAQIEAEVQRILTESYSEVREILTTRRKELDLLAQALVKYETLDRAEVDKVIRGEKLDRPDVSGNKIIVPVPAEEQGLTDVGPAGGPAGGPPSGQPNPSPTPGGIITAPK